MAQTLLRNRPTFRFQTYQTREKTVESLQREIEELHKFYQAENDDLRKQLETILKDYGDRITALET